MQVVLKTHMFDTVLSSFVTELNSNQTDPLTFNERPNLSMAPLYNLEIFSFNNQVGERNKDNGFTPARDRKADGE